MDPISNFLNKLKLAARAGKESFLFPASQYIAAIAAALLKAGYIASVGKRGKKSRFLEVRLLYQDGAPKVTVAKRVSRLSQRVYRGARDISTVRNGYGSLLFFFFPGVLTGKGGRKGHVWG